MARLIYAALMSLDGYIEDTDGRFDWAMPDVEVHEFVNDLEAPLGTHLYGRRMYETMAAWQEMGLAPGAHDAEAGYAEQWRATDKIVYSRSLPEVWTPRTRLEREFDAGAVTQLRATSDRDISVSGPGLAQHAFAAGLVDDVHLFVFPIVVGGGKPALPQGQQVDMELVDQRRFGRGVVHLHYVTRPPAGGATH